MKKLIAVPLLLMVLGISQEAKIMIVERSDSAKLSAAYKDYKEAQSRWESVKTEVAKRYTMDGKKTLDGWEKVQFSADFRALVPETSQYASRLVNNCWQNTGISFSGSSSTANIAATTSDYAVNSTEGIATGLVTKEPKK